ncbi:MAG: tRNA nucleotidyltransferase (CCA-adding enzyme) [Gammaproteobacteria bacterium]|jgi:tRNA nucleotidyltransferase (CCA-adding enzyme)
MKIYLVGGAVRDQLLGRRVRERDWVVVGATPLQMDQRGFRVKEQGFPVYLHPETREEYALARRESKTAAGHKGFEFDFDTNVTLEEDLRRRDLTVNAIAQAASGLIIDPYSGVVDLHSRRLRHVTAAFTEDPLRILRLARFQAELCDFHFTIDEHTAALAAKMCTDAELQALSRGRIWREVSRALAAPAPGIFFQTLDAWGALTQLIPWLRPDGESLTNSIAVLTRASAQCENPHVRLGALLVSVTLNHGTPIEIDEKWPIPAAVRALTQLCINHPLPSMRNAETIMNWLEGVDAWRRSDRFADLSQVWLAVDPTLSHIINSLRRCCDISRHVPVSISKINPRESVRAYRLQRIVQAMQCP